MIIRLWLALGKPSLQGRVRRLLPNEGVLVQSLPNRESLWERLGSESFDLLIINRTLLPDPLEDFIRIIRELPESPTVVVLSREDNEVDRAELLATGCRAVLSTKLSNTILREALEGVFQELRLEQPAPAQTGRPSLSQFVSLSPAMQAFLRFVRRVVNSDTSLLIMGETGVGKEWLARAVHAEGPRSEGPFIAVNCGALPEALLESELFGHERGSFTGAARSRRGMFELAHTGTIFLDEIGEMPLHLQVKLLRVLQSREIIRVGGEQTVTIDVRIIAATNRNLETDVQDGHFRQDLYYRLGVVNLVVPPVRERREDIPDLIDHYIEHFRGQFPQVVEGISEAALNACLAYDWPGNVRELINVVERALLLCEGEEIELTDLPEAISQSGRSGTLDSHGSLEFSKAWLRRPYKELKDELLQSFERAYFGLWLEETEGRIGDTAERIGLDPRSLYSKMKKLGFDKKDFKP